MKSSRNMSIDELPQISGEPKMKIDFQKENERANIFFTKWSPILSQLGFECVHMFQYKHPFYQVTIDFSAVNEAYIIPLVIQEIHKDGVKCGEKRIKQQFKDLMSMEEE